MIEHCQTRSKSAKLLIELLSKPSTLLAMQGARKVPATPTSLAGELED